VAQTQRCTHVYFRTHGRVHVHVRVLAHRTICQRIQRTHTQHTHPHIFCNGHLCLHTHKHCLSNTPRVRTHTRMCTHTHTHTEAHSHRRTCLHTCLLTHACPGPCTYTPTHPQTKHIQRMKGSGRRHPQGLACKDTLDRAVAETRPDMQVHAVHGHERLSSMGTCAGQHARKPWTGRLLKPELMGSYVLCLVSSGCYDFLYSLRGTSAPWSWPR